MPLHESGAEESTVFILKDLRKIKMVDGDMRLNPYKHDRKWSRISQNSQKNKLIFSGKEADKIASKCWAVSTSVYDRSVAGHSIAIKEQKCTVQYQFIYEIVVVFQSFWVDLSSSIYTMWYQ